MSTRQRSPNSPIERAVKAAQIYYGSTGIRLRDQQRLYERMERAIASVARQMNMDLYNVAKQIEDEAQRRGSITALAGHHF